MRKLSSFMQISLDGYFADSNSDMRWAHKDPQDAEWNEFVSGNASGGGALLFGRVTYDMMASFWPTPLAKAQMPVVAAGMNRMPKLVASRSLKKAGWENTEVIQGDLLSEIRKIKESEGPDIAILGSGSLVSQLGEAGLIDAFLVVVNPTALGAGKPLFGGIGKPLDLTLGETRVFRNGAVLLRYSSKA
jgi:dihydrofolate reductase